MKELKVNDRVDIDYCGNLIKGTVQKIEYDRIKITIDKEDIEKAKPVQELDNLQIIAHTRMGLKKTEAAVIDTLSKINSITVENNDAIDVVQKRKYVRAVCDFKLTVEKSGRQIQCEALDISACGIAIKTKEKEFEPGDEVKIYFEKEPLGKNITVFGKIVKMNDLNYGIAYNNLSKYDEDLIMKFVFKIISQNKDTQE